MSTHDTERDYPVIDRVRDDEPDDPGTTALPVDRADDFEGFDEGGDPERVADAPDATGTDRFEDTADPADDPLDDPLDDPADTTGTLADTADTDRTDAEVAPLPMPLPADPEPVEAEPVTDPATDAATGTGDDFDDAWRELQVTFVDDPAAAVQGAAELVERAVAELRTSLEGSGSTEDQRTAFRRYRDIFQSLR